MVNKTDQLEKIIDPDKVFPVFAGSAELSPFHQCYCNQDTILRAAAGRLYVHYNGEDIGKTYWALRQNAALYDVPERPLEISGPYAVKFLNLIFTRMVDQLRIGRGYYSLACTSDGGIFMDGILFKLSSERFWFVQPDGDMNTWLIAHKDGFDVKISDPNSRVLQIQGPSSLKIMYDASNGQIDATFKYFNSGFYKIGGQEVYVSRTGWSGELGYEIYTQGKSTNCMALWNHLTEIGKGHGMLFSSMQSINIRRIEAGIFDSGSDFDVTMTPYEAGLEKFVDLTKESFIGRQALIESNAPKDTRIYGIKCQSIVPKGGLKIFDKASKVGMVTTGAYSPFLKTGIGYVRFDRASNWREKKLTIQAADNQIFDCKILSLPFYDKEKKLPRE